MHLIVSNVIMPIEHQLDAVYQEIYKKYRIKKTDALKTYIIKKSLDVRKNKGNYIYSIYFEMPQNYKYKKHENVKEEEITDTLEYKKINPKYQPVVVGFGPAGIFAALYLARCGAKPIIIERGSKVEKRLEDVKKFSENGILDVNSNVQFGEGGAGTFSDGKLVTNVKNPLIKFILREFINHGALENIFYEAKPHVGTDYIVKVVKNIREEIIQLGGVFLFDHTLIDITINDGVNTLLVKHVNELLEIKTDRCILALGHSARDTFKMLRNKNFALEAKNFSIGVRIEHLQKDIDLAQYKNLANKLPVASYKLSHHLKDGRGVYTFCMCPGGVVMASSSNNGEIVTNGMSYNARDLENANSAVLVSVTKEDFGDDDVLNGLYFQEKYEKMAYNLTNSYKAPCQLVGDFLNDRQSKAFGRIKPTYKPGVEFRNLKDCLPDFVVEALKEGLLAFDKKIAGFASSDAVLTGVETRSSSPVRILRNNLFESNYRGIYPVGEGAGYAGGITSAALDGLRCAISIVDNYEKGE